AVSFNLVVIVLTLLNILVKNDFTELNRVLTVSTTLILIVWNKFHTFLLRLFTVDVVLVSIFLKKLNTAFTKLDTILFIAAFILEIICVELWNNLENISTTLVHKPLIEPVKRLTNEPTPLIILP